MGGIATKRCESCRKLVMVSDRGDVETVGSARSVATRDGIDRAICVCGGLVSWPRPPGSGSSVPDMPAGMLALAHPRNLGVCARDGHDPLNGVPVSAGAGRAVPTQLVCKRCGTLYAIEVLV